MNLMDGLASEQQRLQPENQALRAALAAAQEQIAALPAHITALQAQIADLQAQRGQNSHHSHWPPSRDQGGAKRQSHSLRPPSAKKPGGSRGIPGTRWSSVPSRTTLLCIGPRAVRSARRRWPPRHRWSPRPDARCSTCRRWPWSSRNTGPRP